MAADDPEIEDTDPKDTLLHKVDEEARRKTPHAKHTHTVVPIASLEDKIDGDVIEIDVLLCKQEMFAKVALVSQADDGEPSAHMLGQDDVLSVIRSLAAAANHIFELAGEPRRFLVTEALLAEDTLSAALVGLRRVAGRDN